MAAEIRMPRVYDRYFYLGEDKTLRNVPWVVKDVYVNPTTDTINTVLVFQVGATERVWTTQNLSLLDFSYSGAPKYAVNDEVCILNIFEEDNNNPYLAGTVVEVKPSWNSEPNFYVVNFINNQQRVVSEKELFVLDFTKLVDSAAVTLKHIARVRALLGQLAIFLIQRGDVHDASKFLPIEKIPLDAMQYVVENEGNAPYGSDEYKRRTAILKPMLKHHQSNNRHHPEFHENGLYGMNLMDICEMWADWAAAAERGGDAAVGLTYAADRYGMADQLKVIFKNTYNDMGIPNK
ncbi:hypothetical protein [Rhizobium phage RHph_N46]|nr:hypothetical protein [Rhizobium phage RHph_N46]